MKVKIIEEYPAYRIREDGIVESCYKPKTSILTDTWQEVKQVLDKSSGYYLVTLCYKGKRQNKRVHRLLMEAFVPNPENKPQVNHKDGNKLNNCLSNLEWATSSENSQHSYDNGLSKPPNEKEIEQWFEGNLVNTFVSLHEAGRQTGIAWQNISKVCRNERKHAGGFQWKYK